MSLIIMFFALIVSSGMDVETPEEFLVILAESDAELWIEHQYAGNNTEELHPDSIRAAMGSLTSLSVEPGERLLVDVDGGYRVIFPESRWTWRMEGGRIGSVQGESVLEWRPGGYSWAALPILTEEGASIGRKESLCLGGTITLAVGLVGIIAIWYAKRRYG